MSSIPIQGYPQNYDPQTNYVGPQYVPQYYAPRFAYPQPQVQAQPQPYVQQVPQMQPSISGLSGKVVDSYDVVKATDIPMDNNTYYFPKADKTEVYSKRWLSNGTTETLVYKLSDTPQAQSSASVVPDWSEKINSMDERINKLEKMASNNKPVRSSGKKEEAE